MLAAKTFIIDGVILPTAVIIFPIVYIVNDVLAEIYGFKKARAVILLGFVLNLLAVLAYSAAIALPAPMFATESAAAFAVVLGSTGRVLVASFAAYLIGSFVNAYVMVKLKEKLNNYLMLRCIASTFIGEGFDAIIFITIAFIGTMPFDNLVLMIIAQSAFKTFFEIVFYPITKTTISHIRKLAE